MRQRDVKARKAKIATISKGKVSRNVSHKEVREEHQGRRWTRIHGTANNSCSQTGLANSRRISIRGLSEPNLSTVVALIQQDQAEKALIEMRGQVPRKSCCSVGEQKAEQISRQGRSETQRSVGLALGIRRGSIACFGGERDRRTIGGPVCHHCYEFLRECDHRALCGLRPESVYTTLIVLEDSDLLVVL